MEIASGTYKIKADSKQARKDNKKLGASLKGLAGKAGLGAIASPAGLATAAIAGIGLAAGKAIANTVNLGGQLHKMSARTGVSVESLSQMQFALEQSDASMKDYQRSLQNQARFVDAANEGNKRQIEAFQRIGLSVQELNEMSPEERFLAIADGLAAVEDPAERAALSMRTVGAEAGPRLLPLLEGGRAGIEKLKNEADALGRTISTDTADASAKLQDDLNSLKSTFTGLTNNLTQAVIPKLSELVGEFNDNVIPVLRDDVAPLVKSFSETIAPAMGKAFEVAGILIGDTIGRLGTLFAAFKSLQEGNFKEFGANILSFMTAPFFTIEKVFRAFGVNFGDIWVGIQRTAQSAINNVIGGLEKFARPFISTYNAIAAVVPGLSTINFSGGFGRASFASRLTTSGERAKLASLNLASLNERFKTEALAAIGGGGLQGGAELFRGGTTATAYDPNARVREIYQLHAVRAARLAREQARVDSVEELNRRAGVVVNIDLSGSVGTLTQESIDAIVEGVETATEQGWKPRL